MTLPEDVQPASIIACCANPSPEQVISQYRKRIIRISDHLVVKCGPDVTKKEADNQRIAYECLDSRIVRIPRVDAFFSDEQGLGYIVMEFIDGKVIGFVSTHPATTAGALSKHHLQARSVAR